MVNRQILERYLEKPLGEFKYSHQGVRMNCPKCDEGSKFNLEININKNIFNCWSCRYSGVLRKLLEDYASDLSWEKLPEFKKEAVEDNVERKQLNYPEKTIPVHLNKEAYDYLINERKMNPIDLRLRGVAYVHSEDEMYFGCICFPFYEGGIMVGACLLDYRKKRYRNLGKLDFVPYKEFINPRYPIIITEGVFDALSGTNAIPMLRTEINKQTLEYIQGKDVIVAVDNKVQLEHYADLLKRINLASPRSIVLFDMYDHDDMNDFYRDDPKLFFNEIKSAYKQLK